jgi:ubiquinone/menaquinone biosynthesis C-methylase UbiE
MFLKHSGKSFQGLELHGLDHSPFAVKVTSQQVPGVKAKVGDALATKYPAKHFDTVTCIGSLEHYPDSVLGLREIHRILKDDGQALIFVPNLFFLGYIYLVWRTGEPPHEAGQNEYERFETRRGWEELFEKVGFQVESCEKYNEMVATQRMPNFIRVLFNWFVAPLVPLNLSYGFSYVVRKAPRKR